MRSRRWAGGPVGRAMGRMGILLYLFSGCASAAVGGRPFAPGKRQPAPA